MTELGSLYVIQFRDPKTILQVTAHISCQRILFLESIAGVPGMVAATLRHLTSLRLMVRIDIRRSIFFFHFAFNQSASR